MRQHTFFCDKLIRSKDAHLIENRGIQIDIRSLSSSEKIHYLKKKLIEEAQEVTEAMALPKALDELIDVYDAVYALRKAFGISEEDFRRLRDEKNAKRGTYEEGVCLKSLTLEENHPEYAHYHQRPHRYSERLGG